MNILFDISHPAHVHMFKNMIRLLEKNGHKTSIVARQKEVTIRLLENYNFPYISVGRSGHKSRVGQLYELLARDWTLIKIAKVFKADLIVTRNPSGTHAAKWLGIPSIFDTDDGRSVGVHYKAAAPFATVITTPDCLDNNLGKKQVTYPGYKQGAYLHPEHFKPNPKVLSELGVESGETFFIVRFVSWSASHDKGEAGLSRPAKQRVIETLQRHGRVFITSEDALPTEWRHMEMAIPPEYAHDALYYATLYLGDSQTMAAEAAVLGTPSLRVSSFGARTKYLEELEARYDLVHNFLPNDEQTFFEKLDSILNNPSRRESLKKQHKRMLSEKINVADWFVNYIQKNFDPQTKNVATKRKT